MQNRAMQRVGRALGVLLFVGCAKPLPPKTTLNEQPTRMVSAFFGLDHAMPESSRGLCFSAPGQDGMPVTFSRRVVGDFSPSAFAVKTRSGRVLRPSCATTRPAAAPSKNHTVLLIGELGREPDDPPVSVEVTGSVPLEDGHNAQGLSGPVTALAEGPTLALAMSFAPGAIPSDCPASTRQVVMVVWTGGVRPGPAANQELHRIGYRVTVGSEQIVPFALGDLNDRDNYVHLCLDRPGRAVQVGFVAGVLVDPRGDQNPATEVPVSASSGRSPAAD